MNFLQLSPNDSAWMKRWLRSNLSFFLVIVVLLIALRYEPEVTGSSVDAGYANPTIEPLTTATTFPPTDGAADQGPVAVAPTGWRLTRNGWENVASWTKTTRTIDEMIADQTEQEPAILRVAFERIRGVSPLMIALLQISAVAMIINVARSRQK